MTEKQSLYDRLGGLYSIATVVEDLTYSPAIHGRSIMGPNRKAR